MKMVWAAVLAALLCGVAGAQAMVHPGVLVSGSQLNYMKAQVKAKAEPFYGEFLKAKASEYGALDYKMEGPPADGVIQCGAYSRPNFGCHAEDMDGSAAYVQALLWYITGDHRYAENAIKILNAYGSGLKAYSNSNEPLQAAWSAETLPRSAEILRYSNAGWKPADIAVFTHMLQTVILPLIIHGSGSNGNWELSMIDGMMNIAVFTNDRKLLDRAEGMWMQRVPAYFYNEELDGPHPRSMPRTFGRTNWYGTTDLNASVDGMAQETCRDLGHTGFGIAATMNAAETAHIQGGKLYEAEEKRLVPALEFHAGLYLQNKPVPKLVCGGHVKMAHEPTFAIGYNEYHNRLGVPLPLTKELLQQIGARPNQVDPHMIVFELLTDAEDVGSATKK